MISLPQWSPRWAVPILAEALSSLLYPFALAVAWAAASAPLTAGDDGHAGDPVPMRMVLAAEAYASGAGAVMAAVDRPALLASTASDCGLLITAVTPGSQADRLGIVPGSRVIALDDLYIPTHDYIAYYHLRRDRQQRLTVWIAGLGEKTVTIEPGLIGVTWETRPWQAALTYLHGTGRAPACDDDMLVACLAEQDVDLRETALARVLAGKVHPPPWYSLAARVASARGHYEDAIRYAHLALAEESDRSATFRSCTLIVNAALACDDLAEARVMMDRYGVGPQAAAYLGGLLELLDGRMAHARELAQAHAPTLDTRVLTLAMRGAALTEVKDRLSCDGDRGARVTASLLQGRRIDFKVPHGRRFLCPLLPLGHDGSLSGTIVYERTAGRKEDPHQDFTGIGIYSYDAAGTYVEICQASIDQAPFAETIITQAGKPFSIVSPAGAHGAGVANHVRITAIADRIECELNGVIIYRSAIDDAPERKLGGFFMFQETSGSCTEVGWRIDDKSAAAAPLPRPAPAQAAASGADDF